MSDELDPRRGRQGDGLDEPPPADNPDVRPSVVAYLRRPSVRARLAGQELKSE